MSITYRRATLADTNTLIKLRLDYSTDDKGRNLTDSESTAITTQLRGYIPREIGNKFIAYVAEIDGKPLYEKLGFVCNENTKYTEMKLRLT